MAGGKEGGRKGGEEGGEEGGREGEVRRTDVKRRRDKPTELKKGREGMREGGREGGKEGGRESYPPIEVALDVGVEIEEHKLVRAQESGKKIHIQQLDLEAGGGRKGWREGGREEETEGWAV